MTYVALLTDTCAIVRRTPGAFNTGTGNYAAPSDAAIYSGPCRVSPLSGLTSRVTVGEEAVINQSKWVFLPPEATGPTIEDVVTVMTSEDTTLVGKEMVVRDVAAQHSPLTAAAARWLVCEDIREGP